MQSLDIPATHTSPLIRFEPEEAVLRMEGESYPEYSFEFYQPVMIWLKERLGAGHGLSVVIDISYMNSSSTKCMLDILDLLEEAHGQGAPVRVEWRYDAANPRALDLAHEFEEEVTFPFAIVAVES
ncbi:hypothetical protein NNJEOMEG_00093 [Fundidesulfovibrio magnetotacticus]|uniref:SiaC family regulatory phosphoprotein domain-containing protein n=1 Tax=Fundidesulfovibrio magnetotacticus TaxID=2730080 RepID=A0A6V8LP46_9BACT|nr:SiaC family regulatory phosphoprotein [Fundidesulfovibrio magnetotacticus]GFK92271.1 hypothetical protein NNJEOMEG_00093 [Fundidesulfovibrio magnetotacticus]